MILQNHLQQNRVHYKNYFLLLVICLLAYWPLTFGIFSVKNDAIHYFLPYRFQISEALRNGEAPFWSPYVYLGNPVMGDMQSGAWNPVVWLFSMFGRYDLTLFHFENLLYIFLGGVGMYKLTNRFVQHSHTALLIAVSYMLSGFMLGGQLINWLAAAAFIPFVIHYYLLTLQSLRVMNAIKTGIALFLLFTAGYPSFFILTGYLLIVLFITNAITRYLNRSTARVNYGKILLVQAVTILVFAGLALPAIVSFIDLLPYYQRGAGASYQASVSNAFEAQHFLTLFFPASIKANDIISSTDVTCRNIYFGIIPLLLLTALPPKLNRRNILLGLLALFAMLFSLGDATPVRRICYEIIPLLNTFRHPSQMRVFFILAILLLAAPALKKILNGEMTDKEHKKIRLTIIIMGVLLIIISVGAFTQSTILSKINQSTGRGIKTALKHIIESVSLADTIALNAVLQLLFIATIFFWQKKWLHSKLFFSILWIVNLFIMAQLVLPASFVSRTSPKAINSIIHSSPKGFPVDSLQHSLILNSKDAFDNFDVAGLSYFYNKKIGISKVTNSPAFLSRLDSFIQTSRLYNYVASMPVVYMADTVMQLKDTAVLDQPAGCKYAFVDSTTNISSSCDSSKAIAVISRLSSNSITVEVETAKPAFLVLTQNYSPHWKVSVDGKENLIYTTNMSFMGVSLSPLRHSVVFTFEPRYTILAMRVQLVVIIILVIGGLFFLFKQKKY